MAAGVYKENLDFSGKNIRVTSIDPLAPGVIAETVIDGGAAGSVVVPKNGETRAATLTGFTITNGASSWAARRPPAAGAERT